MRRKVDVRTPWGVTALWTPSTPPLEVPAYPGLFLRIPDSYSTPMQVPSSPLSNLSPLG